MKDLKQLKKDYDKLGETIAKMEEPVFEYPIYKKRADGNLVMKFTGLTLGEVIVADEWNNVGDSSDDYIAHTAAEHWVDCEAPKWKPTEPTWCWCWNEFGDFKMKRLVIVTKSQYETVKADGIYGAVYINAEPCEEKDIPQWWKDMKC